MKIKKQERYKDITSYFERIEGEIRKQNKRGTQGYKCCYGGSDVRPSKPDI